MTNIYGHYPVVSRGEGDFVCTVTPHCEIIMLLIKFGIPTNDAREQESFTLVQKLSQNSSRLGLTILQAQSCFVLQQLATVLLIGLYFKLTDELL